MPDFYGSTPSSNKSFDQTKQSPAGPFPGPAINAPSNLRVYSSMSTSDGNSDDFESGVEQLNVYWDDNSSNEDEFRLQVLNLGAWEDIDTVSANTTFYAWNNSHSVFNERTIRVGAVLDGYVSWSSPTTLTSRSVHLTEPDQGGYSNGALPGVTIDGKAPLYGEYNWESWGSSNSELRIPTANVYEYNTTASDNNQDAVVETLCSDFRIVRPIYFNTDPPIGKPGIIFRASDSSNYYVYEVQPTSTQRLIKVQGGSPTTLSTTSGGANISGNEYVTLYIKVTGSSFYGIMYNGFFYSNIINYTLPSFNSTETKHGIRGNNTGTTTYEHFSSYFMIYDGVNGNSSL